MENNYAIRDAIRRLYRGEIDRQTAEGFIARTYTSSELAEFIVDAHQRGWISNFNLGLNEEGNPI